MLPVWRGGLVDKAGKSLLHRNVNPVLNAGNRAGARSVAALRQNTRKVQFMHVMWA